jgi:dihydrolipoamide dehydrogenase
MDMFDIVIIGAGPGGYSAAIRAAQHGAKTALIEEKNIGGVCLNIGCIPTKAMLYSASLMLAATHGTDYGLHFGEVQARLADIVTRREQVVQRLTNGVATLLKANRLTVFNGRGRLLGNKQVQIQFADGRLTTVAAKKIILATGSRPAVIPAFPPDGKNILNSDHILKLTDAPAHLLILGGGYIGCEFACIFQALGSKVTIVEALDRLLPQMDADLGNTLGRLFKKAGMQILVKTKVTGVHSTDTGVTATLDNGAQIAADKLLVCIGRVPNTENIGLETEKIALDGKFVRVNECMETSAKDIYAIGDVCGKYPLAHTALAQARVAVQNAMANNSIQAVPSAASGAPRNALLPAQMHYEAVPAVVFTFPEIGSVGYSEEAARAAGFNVATGKFHFAALGKAVAVGQTDGFVKWVADADTREVLGCHIIGGHASELIAAPTMAIHLGAKVEDVAECIYTHPTFAEALGEAAEDVFGLPVHAIKKK